jgi:hypothetical protein
LSPDFLLDLGQHDDDEDDALRRGAWLVPAEACFVFTEQVGGLRCVPRLALWRRFGKN